MHFYTCKLFCFFRQGWNTLNTRVQGLHTSSADLPTTALHGQRKGINVRAVKPVTPPVMCVRQPNSDGKIKGEGICWMVDKRINKGERKSVEGARLATCRLSTHWCMQGNCLETGVGLWDGGLRQLWLIARGWDDVCEEGFGPRAARWGDPAVRWAARYYLYTVMLGKATI